MTDANLDVARTALLGRPTGLGTSAARLAEQFTRARSGDLDPPLPKADLDPAYAERPWGDGTASPLYCPVTERINEPLADEVDERLAVWAKDCGFDDDEIKKMRKARFGRLVML
ncbi:MAG: family 2 encapsulin nanocompartment cargo protein terpene cyclase, partial [Gammaproteobacteria bacterium]